MRIQTPFCLLLLYAIESFVFVGCDQTWHDERCTIPGTNAFIDKCTDCNWRPGTSKHVLNQYFRIIIYINLLSNLNQTNLCGL